MADNKSHHRTEREVVGPLVSTGMGRGLHAWLAIALVCIAVVLYLAAQKITNPMAGLLFLAGAIGLLGEIPNLIRTGEVRARQAGVAKPNRFLIIRKADSPVHFMFYVVTYAILGGFSLAISLVFLWGLATTLAG